MALLADVFPQASGFLSVVTGTTQVSACILHKSNVCQDLLTEVTAETLRVPAIIHCLDNTANDEFTALMAAWGKEHLEIVFTVLPSLKLIEEPLWKLLEALCTHKALLMVQLSITVHNLLCRGKAGPTALTHCIRQSIRHVA